MGCGASTTEVHKPLQIVPHTKTNQDMEGTDKNEKSLDIKSSIR